MSTHLPVIGSADAPPASTVIAKIVGNRCNLRCRYCFYSRLDQDVDATMTDDILERLISGHLGQAVPRMQFVWHGGEPLLAGRAFFRKALSLQEKHANGSTIRNAVQTNATLIDDHWAKFLADNRIGVGVSVDGNARSHSRNRLNTGGRSSFDSVIRGIDRLRGQGINPGYIQTLTRATLVNLEEDFRFFYETLGAKSWGINVYLDDGGNPAMSGQSVTSDEWADYLERLLDLWLQVDDPRLRIREIDNLLAGVIGKSANSCAFNGNCSSFYSVEPDGSVYPCDRFSGQGRYLFGSLARQSLQEILSSPTRLSFTKTSKRVAPECDECEWQRACNNGCTHHRSNDALGRYAYCSARKRLFSRFREKLTVLEKGADND